MKVRSMKRRHDRRYRPTYTLSAFVRRHGEDWRRVAIQTRDVRLAHPFDLASRLIKAAGGNDGFGDVRDACLVRN